MWDLCWKSGTGTDFSPSFSVFPSQYIIPPSVSKLISSEQCVYVKVSRHPRLGTRLNSRSGKKLFVLHPFLGTDGFLRVGARSSNADIPYAEEHQMIIPPKHHVTKLLIDYEH
jgi:hypothetical protein